VSSEPGVLLLTPCFSPNTGGIETHLDDLVKYLHSKKKPVTVITYRPLADDIKDYKKLEKLGEVTIQRRWWPRNKAVAKYTTNPYLNCLYSAGGLLFYAFAFLSRRQQRFSVIHAHGLYTAVAGRILGILFKKRLIVSLHAIYIFDPKRLISKLVAWALNGSDLVHCPSDACVRELMKIGVSPRVLRTTYHWVDTERFSPRYISEYTETKPQEGLFVGRLVENKGINVLKELVLRFPDFTFRVIGTGPLEKEVEAFARQHHNFVFEGKVANDGLPKYYHQADFLLIPSQCKEGLPRVIIEAMYCGVPVIGSKMGGIAEAVDSEVGILTDGSVEGFSSALREIRSNPTKLRALSAKCKSYSHAKFGLKNAEAIYASYSGAPS
jgi:glycosyltransferase involved in cell wall biosynthesis